ncbi:hypothetical protein BgiMline_028945 [Biomphalaria glabrata]|nr:hypothetical protein BgiMline_025574 [Biomphalaria glabrata]
MRKREGRMRSIREKKWARDRKTMPDYFILDVHESSSTCPPPCPPHVLPMSAVFTLQRHFITNVPELNTLPDDVFQQREKNKTDF